MATPLTNSAWLDWLAGILGAAAWQNSAAPLPAEQFHCMLDQLPLHLVPGGTLTGVGACERMSLLIHPRCSFYAAGSAPEEFADRAELLAGFYRQSCTAWMRDDADGSIQPFWLGPAFEPFMAHFRAGEPLPPGLPQTLIDRLVQAGIATTPDRAVRRMEDWQHIVATGAESFKEKNYAPLQSLIHPLHVAALRRYFRAAIRRGAIRLGDEQSSRRYAAHNEPVCRFFHRQLVNTVSAIVGEPVKPSYAYLASYLGGAELKKHIDREQCEFSVTVALDFSPEAQAETSWPIQLETRQSTVKIYQALGDGLVYRGTAVPHYRHPLPAGNTSTSIFLHYVAADFAGSLD